MLRLKYKRIINKTPSFEVHCVVFDKDKWILDWMIDWLKMNGYERQEPTFRKNQILFYQNKSKTHSGFISEKLGKKGITILKGLI